MAVIVLQIVVHTVAVADNAKPVVAQARLIVPVTSIVKAEAVLMLVQQVIKPMGTEHVIHHVLRGQRTVRTIIIAAEQLVPPIAVLTVMTATENVKQVAVQIPTVPLGKVAKVLLALIVNAALPVGHAMAQHKEDIVTLASIPVRRDNRAIHVALRSIIPAQQHTVVIAVTDHTVVIAKMSPIHTSVIARPKHTHTNVIAKMSLIHMSVIADHAVRV